MAEESEVGSSLRKIPKLNPEEIYAENPPASNYYEKSFNHGGIINEIATLSLTGQKITMNIDGHIEFWKKVFHLIEFQRHFRAHLGTAGCVIGRPPVAKAKLKNMKNSFKFEFKLRISAI